MARFFIAIPTKPGPSAVLKAKLLRVLRQNIMSIGWYITKSTIKREENIKEWKRQWKIDLIEKIILNGTIYLTVFVPK